MARDQIVEIEVPSLAQIQKRLGDMQHKAPTVMSRTINKTITHMKKLMAEEVRKDYIVKAGSVKKTLKVKKASQASISGEVVSKSNEKLKLISFKNTPANPRPKAPPTFYKSQVRQDSGLKALSGSGDRSAAFVAKMPSGHVGVFQRQLEDKRKNGPRKGRKPEKDPPIAELSSMSIPSMFGSKKLSGELLDKGQAFMHKTLDHEIKYMLEAGK